MKKSNILKKLALLLSLVVLFTAVAPTTYAYYVTKSETVKNTFRPIEISEYDLMLTKTIEHPLGEGYQYPTGLAFDFEIDFGVDYANSDFTVISGMQDEEVLTVDEEGKARVQVTPNVPLYIKGILDGTEVSVTELLSDEMVGFAAKDDVVSQMATITEEGAVLNFVNLYTPEPVFGEDVIIKGEKQIIGRSWKDGDAFSFKLEMMDGDGQWIAVDTAKIRYDKDDETFAEFSFDKLADVEFAEVGTYNFRVTEVAGSEENMSYDSYDRLFSVEVTDEDMDGYLEISKVTAGTNVIVEEKAEADEYTLTMKFTNIYEEAEEPDDQDKPIEPGISPPTGDDHLPMLLFVICAAMVGVLVASRNSILKKY